MKQIIFLLGVPFVAAATLLMLLVGGAFKRKPNFDCSSCADGGTEALCPRHGFK